MAQKCVRIRKNGLRCQAYAIAGHRLCRSHGGALKRVRIKALQNLTIEWMRDEYQRATGGHRSYNEVQQLAGELRYEMSEGTYGSPLEVDPGVELLAEVQRTAGHVAWLRAQIERATPGELADRYWTFRRSTETHAARSDLEGDVNAERAQYVGVWMDLYQRERTHLVRTCQIAIQSGIEERKVTLAERQADQIGAAFYGLLEEMGLDVTDHRVRAAATKWLVQASTSQNVIEG